jgi:hypothetical protein
MEDLLISVRTARPSHKRRRTNDGIETIVSLNVGVATNHSAQPPLEVPIEHDTSDIYLQVTSLPEVVQSPRDGVDTSGASDAFLVGRPEIQELVDAYHEAALEIPSLESLAALLPSAVGSKVLSFTAPPIVIDPTEIEGREGAAKVSYFSNCVAI